MISEKTLYEIHLKHRAYGRTCSYCKTPHPCETLLLAKAFEDLLADFKKLKGELTFEKSKNKSNITPF